MLHSRDTYCWYCAIGVWKIVRLGSVGLLPLTHSSTWRGVDPIQRARIRVLVEQVLCMQGLWCFVMRCGEFCRGSWVFWRRHLLRWICGCAKLGRLRVLLLGIWSVWQVWVFGCVVCTGVVFCVWSELRAWHSICRRWIPSATWPPLSQVRQDLVVEGWCRFCRWCRDTIHSRQQRVLRCCWWSTRAGRWCMPETGRGPGQCSVGPRLWLASVLRLSAVV